MCIRDRGPAPHILHPLGIRAQIERLDVHIVSADPADVLIGQVLSLIHIYLAYEADKEEKLLENPKLLRTPIVRNGKKATVGYQPEVWDRWRQEG